jgi:large conductance mechanosensitive channel
VQSQDSIVEPGSPGEVEAKVLVTRHRVGPADTALLLTAGVASGLEPWAGHRASRRVVDSLARVRHGTRRSRGLGTEEMQLMSGFTNFVLRGSLVELAVAFIMGTAFATVVTALVDLMMGLIGKIGGQPDFSAWKPGGLPLGAFVTALVGFLILSAVVYFLVVKPYTLAKERYFPTEDAGTPADVAVLEEIRDLLASRG